MDSSTQNTNLILDLRDRMARIETKLDGHNEAHRLIDKRFEAVEASVAELEARVTANAGYIAENKTRYATIVAIASAAMAMLSLLGDHVWRLFSGH